MRARHGVCPKDIARAVRCHSFCPVPLCFGFATRHGGECSRFGALQAGVVLHNDSEPPVRAAPKEAMLSMNCIDEH